jgi:hypothetical protein
MARSPFVAVRLLMLAGIVSCFPALARAQYTSTTFFVVAHQDDWQLFMQPNAYNDAQNPNVKVVFIYLTAGDGACGAGCIQNDGLTPYYAARENGAKRAARFVGTRPDASGGTGTTTTLTFSWLKRITRYQYNNTVSYFLRLPDGNGNGEGFAETGNRSLERLHAGFVSWVPDVTGLALYANWRDLVTTLERILLFEATGSSNVWINVQDPNTNLNTDDHSDHTHAGLAMIEAVAGHPCVNQAKFLDYATGARPANLTAVELRNEAAVWGATVSGLIDAGASNTYNSAHNAWIGKNYYNVVGGTGACSF